MEEKQICCCGSSGWTRVIGWLQVIGSGIGIIAFGILLAAAVAVSPEDLAKSDQLTPEQKEDARYILTVAAIGLAIMLVLFVLSFVMGIILLKGSYNKNPRQIHAWIVFTAIFLAIHVIKTIVECIAVGKSGGPNVGATIGGQIVSLAFSLAIQGFCIWVVNTHKKEIIAAQSPVYPVKA